MKKITEKSRILRSNTISKRKINSIIIQLKNIPDFWKKKFMKDDWQIILTDKMPKEYGGIFGRLYADSNKKQIWLNVEAPDMYSNIVYIAFAYYIANAFAQFEEYSMFDELIKRNKHELLLFLNFRGNTSLTKDSIFAELFAFVIETNGKNVISKIDGAYEYVKKWVNGSIFKRQLNYIPNYIEVGVDVIDEQIELTAKAFKTLPKKLQEEFLKEKWKIRLSNEQLTNYSICGLYSSFDKTIFIRSSSPTLRKVIWHEFGHYLDHKEYKISHKKVFEKIFYKERIGIEKLYNNNEEFEYAISKEEEYFAEIFALYILDSSELKKYAFESYNFIKDLVESWN